MQTILVALRSMTPELKLALQDWKEIFTTIPMIINSSGLHILSSIENKTLHLPLQVMTRITSNHPTTCIIPNHSKINNAISTSKSDNQKLTVINAMRTDLNNFHKHISEKVSSSRKKTIAAHYKSTNIVGHKFKIESFVVVRTAIDCRHKL